MPWTIVFHDLFAPEFDDLEETIQDALLAALDRLKMVGPTLGRPRVDTLVGSKHANMKELRFKASDQQWRFAFAFDPERKAIVLVGGAKSGVSQTVFYRRLLAMADVRYDNHIASLERRS